jgi:beta-lactamase regulating signal transducer with metallopeptidase domain
MNLANHLWQSTFYAAAAGVLTLALRGNAARIRYWLWLTASVKFLVPLWLLIALGAQFGWRTAPAARQDLPAVVEEISQPFPVSTPLPPAAHRRLPILWMVWGCGFAVVALHWRLRWKRVRSAVRFATPLRLDLPIPVLCSPARLEPGVFGVLRPVLLLPEGIAERLTTAELDAVVAHELCHVRRRDNLGAALHMLVESLFWFHPLVWWMGGRLLDERERACDEEVLRLGGEPRVYAQSILKVCEFYLESPVACVAGVTGANLKRRIEAIVKNRGNRELSFGRKLLLAAAGLSAVAGPLVIGMMHTTPIAAQQRQAPVVQTVAPAAPPLVTAVPPSPAAAPAALALAAPQDEADRRAYAMEHYSMAADNATRLSGMGRVYVRYGPPDQKLSKGTGEIWRYNYLEDFRSDVEFEFSHPNGFENPRVNWPLPATFEGLPGVSVALVEALDRETHAQRGAAPVAGLPVRHAAMLIYAGTGWPRTLTVPLDSLTGQIDILGQVQTRPNTAEVQTVAVVRDHVRIASPAGGPSNGTYTAGFTLPPGSYICSVILREQSSGTTYGETINFEVK